MYSLVPQGRAMAWQIDVNYLVQFRLLADPLFATVNAAQESRCFWVR